MTSATKAIRWRPCGGLLVGLWAAAFATTAVAGEKPPVSPDPPQPLSTASRISASIEFGLPAIASAIERDIPRRLATLDQRIGCVNRRVLVFRVRANCDVDGFVDRGRISLYGRGDHVAGSIPIFGTIEGQGANRFTSRIHGDAEGRAVVEIEARPKLNKDWSIELNFSDSLHWSEPPILHVLGRDIALTKYAEPSVRKQLGRIRMHARDAARRLDLRNKAVKAWEQAFQPVQISQEPSLWLEITPASAAFAGVHANSKVLRGSLELTGTVQTVVGQPSAAASPTPLPALGDDVSQSGTFEILLPVRVDYALLRDKIMQALGASKAAATVKNVQLYPSSGKVVIGVQVAKPDDSDPNAGEWFYLSGALHVDPGGQSVRIADLAGDDSLPDGSEAAQVRDRILGLLKDVPAASYGVAYQNLLTAANERLNRPLANGWRMEGRLVTARLEGIQLQADGISIVLRIGGDLAILYGI